MYLKTCLIAVALLHMGCNPQTKSTKETPNKDASESVVSKNTTGSNNSNATTKSAMSKTGKTSKVPVAPAEQPAEQESDISFESSDSGSQSPVTKVNKQKIRTQSQKTSQTAQSAAITPSANGQPTTCESLCSQNSVCQGSDRQSFCRWDKIKPNCFGLYWKDATRKSVCYHPNEKGCSEELPVDCGVLKPIQQGKAVETVDFLGTNTCSALCKLASGCSSSICSSDNLCTGLYWNDKLLQNRNTVVHESQLTQSLPAHQRVPCGVYNYIA